MPSKSSPATPRVTRNSAGACCNSAVSTKPSNELRRALALDPKLQSAQLTLVHALTESGRAEQADVLMQEFLRADPARELIAKAAEHQRAGRLEEAEKIYREVLRRDPRNLEALRLLALIAMKCEHYGQAEQLLKRAVELAPDYLAAWIDLSRAQLERLDLPAAQASIERAAALNPRSANVQIHVANVEARSGRHENAIESYRRAIEFNPESTAGYLGLGNTLKTVGRQAEAIAAYRRAATLRPEQSESWWSLSNLKTFRFEDAEIETMERELTVADARRRGPRAVLLRARESQRGCRQLSESIRAVCPRQSRCDGASRTTIPSRPK